MPRGLPPGLTINPSTGVVSGVPVAQGAYTFNVRATDSVGNVVRGEHTITVGPPAALTLTATTNPPANQEPGASWTIELVAGGGLPPYTYSIADDDIEGPHGIDADTGEVTGTSGSSGQAGACNATFRVTDALGTTADYTPAEWYHFRWIALRSLTGVSITEVGTVPPAQPALQTGFSQHASGVIPQGVQSSRTAVPSGSNKSYLSVTLPSGYAYGSKTRTTVDAHDITGPYDRKVDLVNVGEEGATPPASLPYTEEQTGLTLNAGTVVYTSVGVDSSGPESGSAQWTVEVLGSTNA